jgi:hypothetical protein
MPSYKKFLSLFASFLMIFTLFDFVAGDPGPVDQPLSFALWISLFVQFFLWISSIDSWGKILATSAGLKDCPAGVRLALGSLFYAFIALLLAWVGLLYPPMKYFLFILQSLALAWAPGELPRPRRTALIAFAPLALLFALNILDSFVIHPYWDPLHHHLAGARLFWERGQMFFPDTAIASYQEGGFELLFLWPHFLFAKANGLGLLPVQVFSQLTHSVLGFGGSLLVAGTLAEKWLPEKSWRPLAVTAFALPVSLQFAVPTAKNDWGIVLLVLAGFWILSSIELARTAHSAKRMLRAQLALAGLMWGFAFLGKLSSGFALAGMGTLLLFRRFSLKEITIFSSGFLLGALPLALRNFGATGDPFFPLLGNLFPIRVQAMGPTWIEALAAYQQAPLGLSRIHELSEEFPLASLSFLVPLLAFARKDEKGLRAAGAGLAVALLLFSFLAGRATEIRLLGPLLPLSALLSVVLLARIASLIPLVPKQLPWALLTALAFVMPYRWSALARAHSIPHAHELTRAYVSGEAQGWFRDHYKLGMRAGLLVETRVYHSLPFPIVRFWDAPRIDARLRATTSGPEFVRVLHELGFTHLILSQEKLDLFYPKELVGRIEGYVLPLTDTHVFTSEHSIVADVNLLLAKSR